jgi:hypothetical protein
MASRISVRSWVSLAHRSRTSQVFVPHLTRPRSVKIVESLEQWRVSCTWPSGPRIPRRACSQGVADAAGLRTVQVLSRTQWRSMSGGDAVGVSSISSTGFRLSRSGRFSGETDPLMEQFNASLPYDKRMWRQDIEGSIGYASALGRVGLLSAEEVFSLLDIFLSQNLPTSVLHPRLTECFAGRGDFCD